MQAKVGGRGSMANVVYMQKEEKGKARPIWERGVAIWCQCAVARYGLYARCTKSAIEHRPMHAMAPFPCETACAHAHAERAALRAEACMCAWFDCVVAGCLGYGQLRRFSRPCKRNCCCACVPAWERRSVGKSIVCIPSRACDGAGPSAARACN
eukprot:4240894-Pleurochrysis_carterae.AAC.1